MVRGQQVDPEIAKAAHPLRGLGKTHREIRETFGLSQEGIRYLLHRYCSFDGLPVDKRKRGPKRKTTILEDCQLFALAKTNRTEPLKILARLFRDDGGVEITSRTVGNRLKEFKGRSVTAVRDDLSDSNKADRIEHCTKMKAILMTEPDPSRTWLDDNTYYQSVVFSDQVMFTLHNGKVKVKACN